MHNRIAELHVATMTDAGRGGPLSGARIASAESKSPGLSPRGFVRL